MHNLLGQATIPAKQRVEKLGSSAEPIKPQRLLATHSQHSPVWLRKHRCAVWRGLSNSLHCFMNRVPQIWQAYILAGIAQHLVNLRRACGLSFKWCSRANCLILWQPAMKGPSICSADLAMSCVLYKSMPRYLNESLLASGAPPTLKAGTLKP